MVPVEIMLVIVFTLLSSVIYVMWRYFDDMINMNDKNLCDLITRTNKFYKNLDMRIDLLEQKLKDGIQSNSICCKSAILKIRQDMDELLELNKKANLGRSPVKVVIKNPEQPQS